jgi:hypothetical protein
MIEAADHLINRHIATNLDRGRCPTSSPSFGNGAGSASSHIPGC